MGVQQQTEREIKIQFYNEVTIKWFYGVLCLLHLTNPTKNLLSLAQFMDSILIYLSTTVLQNPSRPAYQIKLNYFLICTLKLRKEFTKEKKNLYSKCQPTTQQLVFNRDGEQCLYFLLVSFYSMSVSVLIQPLKFPKRRISTCCRLF